MMLDVLLATIRYLQYLSRRKLVVAWRLAKKTERDAAEVPTSSYRGAVRKEDGWRRCLFWLHNYLHNPSLITAQWSH
jgi:hypothetical protein